MSVRLAWESDLPDLMRALVKFADFAKANPAHYSFAKDWNLITGYDNLAKAVRAKDNRNPVYRIGGYLVFCSIVNPWYGGRVLQEWFTIKVGPSGISAEGIPGVLLKRAAEDGVSGLIGGDSSPTSIMAAAYEKAGFTPLTKAYFKGT